jgi:hypothetical protein
VAVVGDVSGGRRDVQCGVQCGRRGMTCEGFVVVEC